MLTIAQLSRYVGRTAMYWPNADIGFRVVIRDVRTRFGTWDCLVEPESGEGRKWVECTTLDLND